MATVRGEVMVLASDYLRRVVGSTVIVRQGSRPLGHGTVDLGHGFCIEIADDVRGEIELNSDLLGTAVATAYADGGDLYVVLVHQPSYHSG